MKLIESAIKLAIQEHGDQKWSHYPYIVHLHDVESILRPFGDMDLLVAAYLHDIVEDTPITLESLELFGPEVVKLITAVTDEPGKNRKERKAKTYPKVKAAGKKAIILKLADRISNVRESARSDSKLFEMYRKENIEFKEGLALYDWVMIDREISDLELEMEAAYINHLTARG